MVSKESYCLRLKDFESNIRTTWQDLQSKNYFYDVTLACEEKQIQAHRFLISSSSPVLQNILEHNSNPHPHIYLRGVKYKELVNLLTFMYQGEVKIDQTDLVGFMAVAQDLKIRGLYQKEDVLLTKDDYIDMDQHGQESNENIVNENITDETSQHINYQGNFKEEKIDLNPAEINPSFAFVPNEEKKGPLWTKSLLSINGSYNSPDETSQYVKYRGKEEQMELNPSEINSSFSLIPKDEEIKSLLSINDSSNSCDLCGKQFSSGANVYTHKLSAHKGVRYPCEKCPVKTTTKGNLKMHIETVHDGIRHSCSFCSISFTSKSKLKVHMKRVHTGMYV